MLTGEMDMARAVDLRPRIMRWSAIGRWDAVTNMSRETVLRQIIMAIISAVFSFNASVYGQAVIQTSTNGREFRAERTSKIAPDDVPDGRRFRGENREGITLRGFLRLPPCNPAEQKLIKLIVRFHTGRNGPTLSRIAAGDLQRSAGIMGDFTRQETKNVFTFDQVNANKLPILLTIDFAGGIDSIVGDQEFILTRIDAYFALKALPSSAKIPNAPVLLGGGNTGKPAPSIPVGNPNEVIYALSTTDHLMWARHEGMEDGIFKWTSAPLMIGNGWAFKHVFSGGGGVIYAVNEKGDLLWYHHDGIVDGTFRWSAGQGKVLAGGWNYKQVFAAGGGVIYAINDNGDLLWFHHSGQRDGSDNWPSKDGKVVGTGWNFRHVFSGGGGVIYALTDAGDLLWYRHDGRVDGSQKWSSNSGTKVGIGWSAEQIFSSGNGIVYIVNDANELIWFRHTGFADGWPNWLNPEAPGKKVGTGWLVKDIFSGANLRP